MSAQPNERLLRTIAEELKVPLIRIARQAELGSASNLGDITVAADGALKLLDSFLVSTQFYNGQLALEPVPLSATLYDVAEELSAIARSQDCNIYLDVGRGSGIVMAHPQALRAAFIGLGYSFIHALDPNAKKQHIMLYAHKEKDSIKTGVVSPNAQVGNNVLQAGKTLYGMARQPIADTTYTSGAGFFVADSLFSAMDSQLKPVRNNKSAGFAGLFLPSTQLALV